MGNINNYYNEYMLFKNNKETKTKGRTLANIKARIGTNKQRG